MHMHTCMVEQNALSQVYSEKKIIAVKGGND